VSCGYPVLPAPGFQQIADDIGRQALLGADVDETVAVVTRQTFIGAKPKEPVRIGDNPVDGVARQSVGSRVSLYSQLARTEDSRRCREYRDRAQTATRKRRLNRPFIPQVACKCAQAGLLQNPLQFRNRIAALARHLNIGTVKGRAVRFAADGKGPKLARSSERSFVTLFTTGIREPDVRTSNPSPFYGHYGTT
jgi:hypothetical protein